MIIAALVSSQLVTPVNQKLALSEEFGEAEASPSPCSFTHSAVSVSAGAMGFSSQDSSVPSSHLPDPHKAAHTVSHGAQGQGGRRKRGFLCGGPLDGLQ